MRPLIILGEYDEASYNTAMSVVTAAIQDEYELMAQLCNETGDPQVVYALAFLIKVLVENRHGEDSPEVWARCLTRTEAEWDSSG